MNQDGSVNMRPGAYPIGQTIILDIIVPPIGTFLWLLKARGWAGVVQLGKPSETTKKRQKWEFWIILTAAYVIMFGITAYGFLTGPGR
jgi:hypothetical protein